MAGTLGRCSEAKTAVSLEDLPELRFLQQYQTYAAREKPSRSATSPHRYTPHHSEHKLHCTILQETKPVPFAMSAWLAKLPNLVEKEGRWPIDILPTQVVFPRKPESYPNALSDHKVLLITSTIYRACAKCKSKQLDNWARRRANEDLLPAAPGAGTHDGRHDLAVHVEHAILQTQSFAGGCTDLDKCSDALLKETIVPFAIWARFLYKSLPPMTLS